MKGSAFTIIPVLGYDQAMPPDAAHLLQQILWLFVLAIPISSVAWTVTHEEIFREPRQFCQQRSEICRSLVQRKFFYLFTCEYCFSHYVTAFFLWFTRFKLLLDDWRGYVLALFALVWVANGYMSFFSRMRVEIRSQRAEADVKTVEATVRQREADQLTLPAAAEHAT